MENVLENSTRVKSSLVNITAYQLLPAGAVDARHKFATLRGSRPGNYVGRSLFKRLRTANNWQQVLDTVYSDLN